MSLSQLFGHSNARSASQLQLVSPGALGGSHFAYLLWDMQPGDGWLSADHPRYQTLPSSRWRPIYLGKATSWGSVKRHLAKDEFGCGVRIPTDKNAINEGLLAYCMTKRRPGWLAMSVVPHSTAMDAQQLEQDGVRQLGWRQDVRMRKKLTSAQVKSAIVNGPNEWKRTLDALHLHYADLMAGPVPSAEGLLFNQMDPAHDGRGR
jgi:hypothetical protein